MSKTKQFFLYLISFLLIMTGIGSIAFEISINPFIGICSLVSTICIVNVYRINLKIAEGKEVS
jgi:hypothetical protein